MTYKNVLFILIFNPCSEPSFFLSWEHFGHPPDMIKKIRNFMHLNIIFINLVNKTGNGIKKG